MCQTCSGVHYRCRGNVPTGFWSSSFVGSRGDSGHDESAPTGGCCVEEYGDIGGVRDRVLDVRRAGGSIGLAPTMGSLHEGHLSLARTARRENDLVVMSIFVNPAQFGPGEDFGRYPRSIERDRELARDAGVDVLFVPATEGLYPGGVDAQAVWVDPGWLAEPMEGVVRPGHFRGVATVVAKLFNIVLPDRAYFGQKDIQQAIIVRRMARDLAFPVEVRVVETVREQDGLALSSRNVYLTERERREATVLSAALRLARELIAAGELASERIERSMADLIAHTTPDARVDYIQIADLSTLAPVEGLITSDAVIAVAAVFGTTRLIDNLLVRFNSGTPHVT
jgi:pantoate--beta-alanine ligase